MKQNMGSGSETWMQATKMYYCVDAPYLDDMSLKMIQRTSECTNDEDERTS